MKHIVRDEEEHNVERHQSLVSAQEAELDDLEARWNNPNYLALFAKPSYNLLTLKAVERQMYISRMFDRAQAVKVQALQLQNAESAEAQQRAFQAMEKQKRRIDEKHAQENEIFQEYCKKNMLVIQQSFDAKMGALVTRQQTLENELGQLKRLEKPTGMQTQPEKVETPMTPRTAKRYSTFKSTSKAPRITVKPLGMIKRRKKRPDSTL
jgi:hypothetical protein